MVDHQPGEAHHDNNPLSFFVIVVPLWCELPHLGKRSVFIRVHLCSSVFICGSDFRHRASAEGLAGTMIKASAALRGVVSRAPSLHD
jgi:hypothetical protein